MLEARESLAGCQTGGSSVSNDEILSRHFFFLPVFKKILRHNPSSFCLLCMLHPVTFNTKNTRLDLVTCLFKYPTTEGHNKC